MIMFNLLEKNQFGAAILLAAGLVLFNAKYLPAQTIKDVNSGETVNDLTVATGETYDTMNVNDGGIANTTTVNTGGNVTVNSGGTASNSVINDGGQMTADTATLPLPSEINALLADKLFSTMLLAAPVILAGSPVSPFSP